MLDQAGRLIYATPGAPFAPLQPMLQTSLLTASAEAAMDISETAH